LSYQLSEFAYTLLQGNFKKFLKICVTYQFTAKVVSIRKLIPNMFQMDFDYYDLPSLGEPTCSQLSASSGSGSSLLPSSGEVFLPSPKLKASASSKPVASFFLNSQ
jgi:hypothetical protein